MLKFIDHQLLHYGYLQPLCTFEQLVRKTVEVVSDNRAAYRILQSLASSPEAA